MATGRNPSGIAIPYLSTISLPAKKPIPACGYKFVPIPAPVRVFYPSGNPYPIAYLLETNIIENITHEKAHT